MGVANLLSNQRKCGSDSVSFFRFFGFARNPRNRCCLSSWTNARIAPCSCSAACNPVLITRASYVIISIGPRETMFSAIGQLLVSREIGKVPPSAHMDGFRVYRDLTIGSGLLVNCPQQPGMSARLLCTCEVFLISAKCAKDYSSESGHKFFIFSLGFAATFMVRLRSKEP